MTVRWCLPILSCLLTGCAGLLPTGLSKASSPFDSFEAAQRAFEQILPYQTQASQLKQFGFDTSDSRNVTLIPYPDLVSRLAPNSGIALADIDRGLRDCIQARSACSVYEFHFAQELRVREGNFLLDFLNFSRNTLITGWRFDARVAVSGGVVLFSNFGGERNKHLVENRVNPLGPLQSAGESVGSKVLK